MKYPTFFDDVPKIRLYDPLAEFLGAIDDGIVEQLHRRDQARWALLPDRGIRLLDDLQGAESALRRGFTGARKYSG